MNIQKPQMNIQKPQMDVQKRQMNIQKRQMDVQKRQMDIQNPYLDVLWFYFTLYFKIKKITTFTSTNDAILTHAFKAYTNITQKIAQCCLPQGATATQWNRYL